jgi:acetyl esterase/lipase
VRGLARGLSVVLTVVAGGVAALGVLPPPTQLAFQLKVFFHEKTPLLVAALVVAALLARLAGGRGWIVAQGVLAIAIVAVALVPASQAIRLAVRDHVALDFGRYLRAPIDDGPPRGAETVVYATVDGTPLALDVYRPAAAPGARVPAGVPAILVLHEGGWSAGDKGSAPRMSARLAASGWAVFDAQYRLAPQPNWKTAIGDVKCAIGWVKRHAKELGIDVDPARVSLLGRSAGAHLAMLAAYAPDEPALPPSCDAGDTRVASVVSYYGPTDLAWGWANTPSPRVFDMRQRVTNYVGGSPEQLPERYRLLSPLTHVSPASPPTLLIHGGDDHTIPVENTRFMARGLAEAGVRHETLVIPWAEHGFDFIFGGLAEQVAEHAVVRFLLRFGGPR